ncbi:MAG TPA: hypothetical protein VL068_09480, partial [Microthrixaceae bacterium]|nr:hypothetical protein [Microthrixaceae bacterium]
MNSESLRVALWLDELAASVGTSASSGEVANEVVSAEFIDGLRDYLNARAVEATNGLDSELPLRLAKSRLEALGNCERMALARAVPSLEPEPITEAMFRGTALDRFVIHQLTVGRVLDPVEALRSMFAADGEADLLDHLEQLEESDEAKLADMLGPLATAVADGWS